MKSNFNIEPSRAIRSLAELRPGATGIVIDIEQTGPVGKRLMDLGLLPNTPIKVLRRAPLGDPSVYELRGYRLCLRRVDAARVSIRTNEVGAKKTLQ
jgi:Fe2+ transport system protein FeoA